MFECKLTRGFSDAAGKLRVSPVETKSTKTYSTVSLDDFARRFPKRTGDEIVLHAKRLKAEGKRFCLPLYMAHLLQAERRAVDGCADQRRPLSGVRIVTSPAVLEATTFGMALSPGAVQTLRGGNRKRRFRGIGGKSGRMIESASRKSRENEIEYLGLSWDYGLRDETEKASRYERHVLITRRS